MRLEGLGLRVWGVGFRAEGLGVFEFRTMGCRGNSFSLVAGWIHFTLFGIISLYYPL